MHGHRFVKGGDLLRDLARSFGAEAIDPQPERRPRRLMEARDLCIAQLAREARWGEACAVKDFVRIGVSDPREQARIRERALERVRLAPERLGELRERRLHRLDSSGVERAQSRLAVDDVHRRALLRARLGEEERAAREVERG